MAAAAAHRPFQRSSLAVRAANTARIHALGRWERAVPHWPATLIERRQRRRLGALVRHAYATVPFYRETMDARGLSPRDLTRLEDLDRLPLIDPLDVQTDLQRFLSSAYDDRRREPSYTSGSESGIRRVVYWDNDSMLRGLAYLERIWPLMLRLAGEPRSRMLLRELAGETASRALLARLGKEVGDYRMLTIRPDDPSTRPLREIWAERTLLPRLPQHEEELSPLVPYETVIEILNRERPRLAFSYGSYVEQFLRFVLDREEKVELPRVWFYTGDRASEDVRRLARSRLDCTLYSVYQTTEMGRLGFECEQLDGLHLNVDLCAVRMVGDDGRDVPAGEQGELVVSSLRNRAMVLINYRLGDVGVLDTEPCPCGRKLPVLRGLQGRRSATLVLADGRQVSSLDLEWAFRTELRPTIRAQLVQRGPGRLHWRLVPFGAADPVELERSLVARAGQLFGDSTVLTVECVDRLESTERGKFERTVLDPAPDPVPTR